MEYLNKYEEHSEYTLAEENHKSPSVSYDGEHVHYIPMQDYKLGDFILSKNGVRAVCNYLDYNEADWEGYEKEAIVVIPSNMLDDNRARVIPVKCWEGKDFSSSFSTHWGNLNVSNSDKQILTWTNKTQNSLQLNYTCSYIMYETSTSEMIKWSGRVYFPIDTNLTEGLVQCKNDPMTYYTVTKEVNKYRNNSTEKINIDTYLVPSPYKNGEFFKDYISNKDSVLSQQDGYILTKECGWNGVSDVSTPTIPKGRWYYPSLAEAGFLICRYNLIKQYADLPPFSMLTSTVIGISGKTYMNACVELSTGKISCEGFNARLPFAKL